MYATDAHTFHVESYMIT